MSKLSEKVILRLKTKGFNRYRKHGLDRLYVNPYDLGVTTKYDKSKKTDKFVSAYVNGVPITKTEFRLMELAKTYIEVSTGIVHGTDKRLAMLAQDILDKTIKEVSE